MQAYKLSKRKEAALDELTEDGIEMLSQEDQDPRTILLKSKTDKSVKEYEGYERAPTLQKK